MIVLLCCDERERRLLPVTQVSKNNLFPSKYSGKQISSQKRPAAMLSPTYRGMRITHNPPVKLKATLSYDIVANNIVQTVKLDESSQPHSVALRSSECIMAKS